MDLLDQNNAKASFFFLGRNIVGKETTVKQLAERGHDICSHGYDHLHYWKVSPFRALSDIRRGWKAIDTALGVKRGKYPFRPPYGKLNIFCLMYLLFHQVPIIYWLVDSGDTWLKPPNDTYLAEITQRTGGTVTLSHDFDRGDRDRERYVLESIRCILAAAKENGMRFLTVSEL
jgi:peptidoglycan/xylan/chitin deacetylase (PgdA/CDA1 family)